MPLHFAPLLLLSAGYAGLRKLSGAGDSGDQSEPPEEADTESDYSADVEAMNHPQDELEGWTFPLPKWGDYVPTRSQEYRAPDHHGVDIMYERSPAPNALDRQFAVGSPNGSKNYFMPDGVPVLCPRQGTIWDTGVSSKYGPWVVIDCGKPFAIYMVHFDQSLLAGQPRGTPVNAGQMIGTVGHPPTGYNLKHLHIEVWYNGPSSSHVDPWPYLKGAKRP